MTKPKILIVDDREENLVAMCAILEDLDIELCTATSGNDALGLMLKNDFFLVLLDVQMPEMDGFEVAEMMKKNRRTSDVPIIFVTAISKEKQHVSRGYRSGAVDYIFKPVDPDIVFSKVTVFLQIYTTRQHLQQEIDDHKTTRAEAHLVLEIINDMIIIVDTMARLVYANQAAIAFCGLDISVHQGKSVDEIFHFTGDESRNLSEFIAGALAMNKKIQFSGDKRIVIDDNNKTFQVEGLVAPICSPAKASADSVLLVFRDTTDKVRASNSLRRTEKIKAISLLSAGVANGIRNPLGAVIQNAQNIKRRLDKDLAANIEVAQALALDLAKVEQYFEQRKIFSFLDLIRISGMRASQIINGLMELSKNVDEEKKVTQLSSAVERALYMALNGDELGQRIELTDVEIEKDYQAGLPEVMVCEKELAYAIYQILKNAASAARNCPNHTLRIAIKLLDGMVCAEFSDQGCGMSEEQVTRATEPFFTTQPEGDEIGLGLTVAYSIVVNAHEGDLTIESKPDQGTTVRILLPPKESS